MLKLKMAFPVLMIVYCSVVKVSDFMWRHILVLNICEWQNTSHIHKFRKRKRILSQKKWRDLHMKGRHKHMEASLKRFDNHRCGTVSTECSHIFTFFWSRKTSVIVEISQLSFSMFVCAFPPEISSVFGKSFPFLFSFFVNTLASRQLNNVLLSLIISYFNSEPTHGNIFPNNLITNMEKFVLPYKLICNKNCFKNNTWLSRKLAKLKNTVITLHILIS